MIKCYSNSKLWLAMTDETLEGAGLELPPGFHQFEEDFSFKQYEHAIMTVETAQGKATIYCHPMVMEDAASYFVAFGRVTIRFMNETDMIWEGGNLVFINANPPLVRRDALGKTA